MAKGKQSVSSTELANTNTEQPNEKNNSIKVSGSPDKMIEQGSKGKEPEQPKMTQTSVKLEDIDPLLSEKLGQLHQDCMNLSLRYMDVGSDIRKIGELVGSYKSVIDQKLEAIKQIKANQSQNQKNNNNKK